MRKYLSFILLASLLLVLCASSISAATYYETATFQNITNTISTSTSNKGMEFWTNYSNSSIIKLVNFTKSPYDNSTRWQLTNMNTSTLVANGTFVNGVASINANLTKYTRYVLFSNYSLGTNYNWSYSQPFTSPVQTNYIKFTRDYENGVFGTGNKFVFVNFTLQIQDSILPDANFSVIATDAYTGASLSNLSVSYNESTYYTTNGTVYLPVLTNTTTTLINFTVNSSDNGGYFNQTYYNINVSGYQHSANLSQSAVSFNAYEKVSNTLLTGVNFSTAYLTNSTHYMRAGTYTVTAAKTGYYSVGQQVTSTALSVSTVNISNLSKSYVNLSLRYNLTNSQVTNFTATFESLNYTYSETVETTNGSIYLPLIAGSWQISIGGASAAPYVFNTTLANGMNNITAYTFASDSYFFSIYDESTGALMNGTAVNVQVIGSLSSFNVTTTNGTWYQDLVQPDAYTIRYSANGYTERFSYFVLQANSHTSVELFLLPSNLSTNVTITLYNQDRALVRNALIKILKYSIDDNSYSVKNMAFTDNDGVAYFDALYNSEFYKFFVEYPAGTLVLATEPSYIRSTQITLQYVSGISGTAFFDTVFGISQSFVFNEDTNSFRLDFNSPSNTVSAACVYVYTTSNNNQLYDTACTNSTTGTVLVAVDNITGTTYQADVFYTVLSQPQYAGSQVADFTDRSDWENTGMLFVLFLTIGIVLIFRENPKLSILTISLPLIFANLVGFVSVEWWIPIAIAAMSVIIVWIISRWS